MATAEINGGILKDVTFMGIRSVVGVIFILHGVGKFNPGFVNFISSLGLPPEMQIPIALAEVVPGILMILGIFTRFSASLLSIVMIGAIFLVKGAQNITGEKAVEFDLILLAVSLLIIVAGPGRISIAHAIKKIPRFIH
jgi:putative oxidoreductase